jgi:hypothetical protein
MKIKINGNQKAQILAGIEPWETAEIDIPLSSLTARQREIIAGSNSVCGLIEQTPEAAIAAIDAIIAEQDAAAAEMEQRKESKLAEIETWIRDAAIIPVDTISHGIRYLSYRGPGSPSIWSLQVPPEIYSRMTEREAQLGAEAKDMSAAALAVARPQIDAAIAVETAAAEVAKQAKDSARAAKLAERLKSGIVTIELSRGSRSEWGEPWIAKVLRVNGKSEYDFSAGSYDTATETFSIPCKPGDVIAYGQKNYRKAKRTIKEVRKMRADGALIAC